MEPRQTGEGSVIEVPHLYHWLGEQAEDERQAEIERQALRNPIESCDE